MKLGYKFDTNFIPEFPVRKGTIDKGIKDKNSSVNIDYFAISADKKNAVFLELKTDMGSRNEKQDDYLKKAQAVGLKDLLTGIVEILEKTRAKRKYCNLLLKLNDLNLLSFDRNGLEELMRNDNLRGLSELLGKNNEGIQPEFNGQEPEIEIVYLQPDLEKNKENNEIVITFCDVYNIVRFERDCVSREFSRFLKDNFCIQELNI